MVFAISPGRTEPGSATGRSAQPSGARNHSGGQMAPVPLNRLAKPPGRAGDGIRTHDNHVGNVVLYQLSYTRMHTLSVVAGWKASPATTGNPVSIAREGVVARSADRGIWKSGPEEE